MFRRFFRSIKNYIRGRPRPMPTEEMKTQSVLSSQDANSGTLTSPSVVSLSALSSEKVKSHCPLHVDPIIGTPTASPSPAPQPDITKPPALIASSSLSRPSKSSSSAPKASTNATAPTTAPVWGTTEMNAETARMMENIMSNTMAFTQNMTNLCSNISGDAGDTNGNTFNVNLNSGTASFTRGPQQGNASFSSSRHTGPSASSRLSQQFSGTSPIPGSDLGSGSRVFYETNGTGFNRGVFVTNGGYLANVGNTISISNGSQSAGYSSYGSHGGTKVRKVGSPHISTHTGSMSVVVVNGRKYAKKQGLGPLGHLTEITDERVVVGGHTYYP